MTSCGSCYLPAATWLASLYCTRLLSTQYTVALDPQLSPLLYLFLSLYLPPPFCFFSVCLQRDQKVYKQKAVLYISADVHAAASMNYT
jgi:hypothetical protein